MERASLSQRWTWTSYMGKTLGEVVCCWVGANVLHTAIVHLKEKRITFTPLSVCVCSIRCVCAKQMTTCSLFTSFYSPSSRWYRLAVSFVAWSELFLFTGLTCPYSVCETMHLLHSVNELNGFNWWTTTVTITMTPLGSDITVRGVLHKVIVDLFCNQQPFFLLSSCV